MDPHEKGPAVAVCIFHQLGTNPAHNFLIYSRRISVRIFISPLLSGLAFALTITDMYVILVFMYSNLLLLDMDKT